MKTFELNQPITANSLNENMFKQFKVKVNFDKYTREDLENYRNLLRTKVSTLETTANFNDLLANETYQKDKYMLGVLNTRIKEMLGEGKKSKPDFLDVDKDGNKKETFKKAVKDKKKNPFKKTSEGAKPDFLDIDKDGNKKETFKKAVKDKNMKKKSVKESKSELMHQAYQKFIAEGIATYISEDEEGKAKSITAAADMVNDFTSWMQRVGNYQTKSMIELADNIRANFGMQEAETFKASVGTALESALNALTASREEINNAVAVLAGEAPAQEPMGQEPGLDADLGDAGMTEPGLEPSAPDELNPTDEFAASDAAAGGPETTGRMKRESIERGNRLMKILGS